MKSGFYFLNHDTIIQNLRLHYIAIDSHVNSVNYAVEFGTLGIQI